MNERNLNRVGSRQGGTVTKRHIGWRRQCAAFSLIAVSSSLRSQYLPQSKRAPADSVDQDYADLPLRGHNFHPPHRAAGRLQRLYR